MARVKVLVGLLLSATLFIASSCITKDYSLGSTFIPTDQQIHLRTVEFDIPVELRMADSLQTSSSGIMSVGSITSPIFGTTRTAAAVTVTPSTDSTQWGIDPQVEKAYLSLSLNATQTLEDDQDFILQNIYVHKLTSPLDSTDYFNNCVGEDDYDPVPISDGCAVYDGSDNFLIPLKDEFVEELFKFTMNQLDSIDYFVKHFFGIYIKCDDVEEGTYGGRINDFSTSDSFISLTFRYTDTDGLRRSKSVTFDLGKYWAVNSVTSGSKGLVTKDAQDAIYTEGYSGIKPVIPAKSIKKMLEKWITDNNLNKSKLLVARACFEFPFEYTGYGDDYGNYPSNLFPCRRMWTTSGKKYLYYNPNTEIEDSSFDHGDINRSLFFYRPDAGIYIQKLIGSEASALDSTYDIWIMPTVTYVDQTTNQTYYFVDYSSYYQAVLNGTKAARHPVMKLTYAVIGEE